MNFQTLFTISIVLLLASPACTPKPKSVRQIEPREAYGMLRNDFAVLVDVREPNETASGAAEGARAMPFSKIQPPSAEFTSWLNSLSKDKEIIFYGGADSRSMDAARIALDRGFKTANLGSIDAWNKAGLPLKKTVNPEPPAAPSPFPQGH